jgi:ketosteroid isomerase-like protein
VAENEISEVELAALVRDVGEAASAFMRGDIRTYLRLIKHADDYTLMAPFGGETVRGFDESDESVEALGRFFTGGEATVELVQSYTSGNLAVLIVMERQHGQVGGLPDQDWPLRVTLVFRRQDDEWLLVHRHADLMVRPIDLDQASALARGLRLS